MATGSRAKGALDPSSDSDQNNNNGQVEKGSGRPRTLATGRLMSNLPYMGELTFDSRPRRGRKPKKADICHLISKNYGISFPVAYVNQPNSRLDDQGPLAQPSPMISAQALLEEAEEPLNLCLKDRAPEFSDSSLVRSSSAVGPSSTPAKGGRGRKRVKKVLENVQIPPANHPPPSEVSICKFKFTGGVKPTLQEKKMLSVDSGGNFRFYSDKTPSRGKGHASQLSPVPPLQVPLQVQPEIHVAGDNLPSAGDSSCSDDSSTYPPSEAGGKRKRRTRKSLMREKLEKTFKEKGFLIQTQQLESAEGATYCKFRQLRKFTRYLFRSWKDYLPENVQGPLSDPALETTPVESPHREV